MRFTSSSDLIGLSTMGPTPSSILNSIPIPSRGSMMSAKIIAASTPSCVTASTTTRDASSGSFATAVIGRSPLIFL